MEKAMQQKRPRRAFTAAYKRRWWSSAGRKTARSRGLRMPHNPVICRIGASPFAIGGLGVAILLVFVPISVFRYRCGTSR
jgi:hypothetical protein